MACVVDVLCVICGICDTCDVCGACVVYNMWYLLGMCDVLWGQGSSQKNET